MTTIEEKLETLTQTLGVVVSELNSRHSDKPAKPEIQFNADPNLGKLVRLTSNIADYDFSEFEAKRGCKIVAIVKAPEFGRENPSGKVWTLLTIKQDDGKEKYCKAVFTRGETAKPAGSSTNHARPNGAKTDSNHPGDLQTVAAAAVNLERLTARTPALQSFYAFTHAKGGDYCLGVLRPLLACEPFPAGASVGQQMAHARGLLAKHIAPEVSRLATGGQSQEQVQPHVESFLPGSVEAFQADPELRRTYGTFGAYRAFMAATGGPAVAQRIQLEREADTPRFVDGAWTLGKIGAFETEWLNDRKLQVEFPTAKGYAAYRRKMG
jgi:hypothetical protein